MRTEDAKLFAKAAEKPLCVLCVFATIGLVVEGHPRETLKIHLTGVELCPLHAGSKFVVTGYLGVMIPGDTDASAT